MFSQRCTSGSRIVASTAARSPSRSCRRTTTPSVIVSGGCTPPEANYLLVGTRAFAVATRPTRAAATVTARAAILAGLARRGVLRPLDELLRRDHATVLVLLDELQADPAASLVHFLHEHVEDVAALR